MTSHSFNFAGGEALTQMGATWFVSYAYFEKIDAGHKNWELVDTCEQRKRIYNRTREYHIFWLQKVLDMNPLQLNRNTIELDASIAKKYAKELLMRQGIDVSSFKEVVSKSNKGIRYIVYTIIIILLLYYCMK